MMLEACDQPIRYRLRSGRQIVLRPGEPVDVPDDSAQSLLEKAGHKVRVVDASAKSPEVQDRTGRQVHWEAADGRLRAGICVLLASTRDGGRLWGWIGVEANDGWYWIREDRLRSRAHYEARTATGTHDAR